MSQIFERYNNFKPSYRRAFFAVFLAMYFYNMLLPDPIQTSIDEYEVAKEQHDKLISDLGKLKNRLTATDEIETKLRKVKMDLQGWESQLPVDPDLEKLLGQMAEFAVDSNVTLKSFVPAAASEPEDKEESEENMAYKTIKVQTEILGVYPKLVSFLDKISTMPRIVRVGKLNLHSDPETNKDPNEAPSLTANVEFEIYLQAPYKFTFKDKKKEGRRKKPSDAESSTDATEASEPTEAAPVEGTSE